MQHLAYCPTGKNASRPTARKVFRLPFQKQNNRFFNISDQNSPGTNCPPHDPLARPHPLTHGTAYSQHFKSFFLLLCSPAFPSIYPSRFTPRVDRSSCVRLAALSLSLASPSPTAHPPLTFPASHAYLSFYLSLYLSLSIYICYLINNV
jgi:hypothetical protein